MILDTASLSTSFIHRRDPRLRICCAAVASVVALIIMNWLWLALLTALTLALCLAARVPGRVLFSRLLAVNAFMLSLLILLPWGVPGNPLFQIGAFTYSQAGLMQAGRIVLRGNAILLLLTALIGTMEPHTFGHALRRLGIPAKLTNLLLFTIRYIAVMEDEYRDLRRAMTVRAFRPRLNLHTLRSIGYLVGMLLVRALDRSERINEAMKCRGFLGRFPSLARYRFRWSDAAFGCAVTLTLAALLWGDWTHPL